MQGGPASNDIYPEKLETAWVTPAKSQLHKLSDSAQTSGAQTTSVGAIDEVNIIRGIRSNATGHPTEHTIANKELAYLVLQRYYCEKQCNLKSIAFDCECQKRRLR